jgi:MFS transporter, DHA1 family, 2-module integral membrane pump EmrD
MTKNKRLKRNILDNYVLTNPQHQPRVTPQYLCCLLAFLSIFFTQMFSVSLPFISKSLNSQAIVISAFNACIFGFGFSQLVYGLLVDRLGGKKVLLIGIMLIILSGFICGSTTKVHLYWFSTFLLGCGAGSCAVVSRTLAKDIYSDKLLVKTLSYISASTTFAAATAPIIGSIIQHYFSWRGNYIFSSLLSLLSLFIIVFHFPRYNFTQTKYSISSMAKVYFFLLKDKVFLSQALLSGIAYSYIICFLIAGAFIYQNQFHLSALANSMSFALCAFFYLLGNFSSSKLAYTISLERIIFIGLCFFANSILLLSFCKSNSFTHIIAFTIAGLLLNFGSGLITPITYKNILSLEKFSRGVTAGGIGAFRTLVAFLVGLLLLNIERIDVKQIVHLFLVMLFIAIATYYINVFFIPNRRL